jgi:uncharacterized protein (DUF983 family)
MIDPNPYRPPENASPAQDPRAERCAPCPRCGNRFARRTKWLGAFGEMIVNVKCLKCGKNYNGDNGESNSKAIVGMLIVGVVVGVALASIRTILAFLFKQ